MIQPKTSFYQSSVKYLITIPYTSTIPKTHNIHNILGMYPTTPSISSFKPLQTYSNPLLKNQSSGIYKTVHIELVPSSPLLTQVEICTLFFLPTIASQTYILNSRRKKASPLHLQILQHITLLEPGLT
jgi:hypothetical protein